MQMRSFFISVLFHATEQLNISYFMCEITALNLDFLDSEPLPFHSSSSSVILTRLSGPRSRPTTYQKIW
jgi:hypothetical protein